MNTKASFRNIDALMAWFNQAKKPFWSVYTGFSKEAKDLAMKNSTIEDMEASANLLEEIIQNKTEGGGPGHARLGSALRGRARPGQPGLQ